MTNLNQALTKSSSNLDEGTVKRCYRSVTYCQTRENDQYKRRSFRIVTFRIFCVLFSVLFFFIKYFKYIRIVSYSSRNIELTIGNS